MFQTQLLSVHIVILSLRVDIFDTGAGKVPQVEFGDQCCFSEKAPTEARCNGRRLALNGKQPEGGNSRWQPGGNLVETWWRLGESVSWCGLWRWQEGGKPGGKEAWEEMAHLHSCQGASSYENLATIAKALLYK